MLSRDQKKRRFTPNDMVWMAAVAVTVVSGLFSLIVSILLIANYVQVQAITPLDNPELLKLRQQLAAAPEAEKDLVDEIRTLDLLTRKAFFTSQAHLKMGGYLLLGGVAVMLAAWRLAARCKPRLPQPDVAPPRGAYWMSRARAGWLVAFAGGLWVVVALLTAFFAKLDFPGAGALAPAVSEQGAQARNGENVTSYPSWEVMQQNWPSFRGPGGYGVAYYTTAPTEWDAGTGKNIKWKTEVPLPGANSPVVWDKRLFLSGATESAREVYCFDTETGQLLWRRALEKLPGTPDKPPKVGDETGYAAPSLVAHGDRLCAIFANGDLVSYDFDGNFKWGKNLGVPDNHYGHSSSLLAYQNLLFVQYDQNSNGKLLALDVADGHEVWTVSRQKISWASPICVSTSFGLELVVNSEKNVDAYDPLTGQPVWRLACLDGEVAPSPAYGGGMFFVANDSATATAIRFGTNEQTPEPEIAWQWDEALPDVASPVGTGQYFCVATSRGQIVCLDSSTGKAAWGQDYDNGFYASPILVGDRIYAVDRRGTAYVFKPGPVYELIASSRLGEDAFATPAFMDGRIYIRTEKNLFCIANSNGP
jgi:outer membrane protein assembly factor BamB